MEVASEQVYKESAEQTVYLIRVTNSISLITVLQSFLVSSFSNEILARIWASHVTSQLEPLENSTIPLF